MNRYLFLIALLFFLTLSCTKRQDILKPPSDYFPKERAKVLVVGTFHFDYPNLDVVKSEDEDKIDVLTEPKKS